MDKNFNSFSQLSDDEVRNQSKAAWQACKSARNAEGFLQNVEAHNSLCEEFEKRLWMRIHGHREDSPTNGSAADAQPSQSVVPGGDYSVAGTTTTTSNDITTNISFPMHVTTHIPIPIPPPTPIIEDTEEEVESPAPPRLNERKIKVWCAIGATVVGVCISGVILYRKIFRGQNKSHSSD